MFFFSFSRTPAFLLGLDVNFPYKQNFCINKKIRFAGEERRTGVRPPRHHCLYGRGSGRVFSHLGLRHLRPNPPVLEGGIDAAVVKGEEIVGLCAGL
mmetsp:Transcript_28051/g.45508  ORF Transcript_28051/g.45508 Transcript_28051/m.45508 type:complete len:97 (+) Transcript_28051:389-679(+)